LTAWIFLSFITSKSCKVGMYNIHVWIRASSLCSQNVGEICQEFGRSGIHTKSVHQILVGPCAICPY
jgi:hypothetical protein